MRRWMLATLVAFVLATPAASAQEDEGFSVDAEQPTGYLKPMQEQWVVPVLLKYPCPPGTLPAFDYYTYELWGRASDEVISSPPKERGSLGAPPADACATPGHRNTYETSLRFHASHLLPAFSTHEMTVYATFYGWKQGASQPSAQYGPFNDTIDVRIDVYLDVETHAAGSARPLLPGSAVDQEFLVQNMGNGEATVLLGARDTPEGMRVESLPSTTRVLGPLDYLNGDWEAARTTWSFTVTLPAGPTPAEPETITLGLEVTVTSPDYRSSEVVVVAHDIDYWVGAAGGGAAPAFEAWLVFVFLSGVALLRRRPRPL